MEMIRGRHSRNSMLGVRDNTESAPFSPSSRSHEIESHGGAAPNVAKWSTPQHCSCTLAGTARSDFAENGNRAQVRPNLTELEELYLEKAKSDRFMGDGRRLGLEVWPKFFLKPEEAGKELKDGLVTIWSTFIIVETLLISISMQPFVTSIPNLGGWQFEVYGLLWMLVLVCDVMGLVVTALMLGYLHAYPGKLTYIWMCKIGAWAMAPSFLVLLCAILGLVAIGFTSWIIYGTKVGAACVAAGAFVVLYACLTASFFAKTSGSVQAIE